MIASQNNDICVHKCPPLERTDLYLVNRDERCKSFASVNSPLTKKTGNLRRATSLNQIIKVVVYREIVCINGGCLFMLVVFVNYALIKVSAYLSALPTINGAGT